MKIKRKKLLSLLLISAVSTTSFGYGNKLYATEDQESLLKVKTTYNDEKTDASILFDLNDIDEEKYQIMSITSDQDGVVVYDNSIVLKELEKEPALYKVKENGGYSFTIKYKYAEKQLTEEPAEESAEESAGESTEESAGESTEESAGESTEESAGESTEESAGESTEESKKEIIEESTEVKLLKEEKNSEKTTIVATDKDTEPVIKENTEEQGKESSIEMKEMVIKQVVIIDGIQEQIEDPHISESLQNSISSMSSSSNEVDVGGMYNLSSTLWEYGSNAIIGGGITSEHIQGNRLLLSVDRDYIATGNMSTVLTYKETVDFSRAFEMSGIVNLGKTAEDVKYSAGLALSFHSDGVKSLRHEDSPPYGTYSRLGTWALYSGCLATYNAPAMKMLQANSMETNPEYWRGGIRSKGIVLEIDTWDEKKTIDPKTGQFGEMVGDGLYGNASEDYGKESNGSHLAIAEINNNGSKGASNVSDARLGDVQNLVGDRKYRVLWTPTDNEGNGELEIRAGLSDTTYFSLKRTFNAKNYFGADKFQNMNMSIGSGNGRPGMQGTKETWLTLEQFKYTDVERNITKPTVTLPNADSGANGGNQVASEYDSNPNIGDRNIKLAMAPNQNAVVKMVLKNDRNIPYNFSEIINLENLKLAGNDTEIVSGTVKTQENDGIVQEYPSLVFDKDHPLAKDGAGNQIIYYPKNSGTLTISFEVKLPDDFKWDINDVADKQLPFLTMGLSVGNYGMSQERFYNKMIIRSEPNVKGTLDHYDKVGKITPQITHHSLTANHFQAKVYDDLNWHPVSEASTNVLTERGKFYYIGVSGNKEEITKNEFDNRSKTGKNETGIYAYDFSLGDSREVLPGMKQLANKKIARVFQSVDEENINQSVTQGGDILLANSSKVVMTVNQITNEYNTGGKFIKYIKDVLSLKGYKDNGGLNLSEAQIQISYDSAILTKPTPGDYVIKAVIAGTNLEKRITLTIQEDPYAYIEIPKYIELESGADGASLVGDTDIKYIGSASSGLTYEVSIDSMFELVKMNNPLSKIDVNTKTSPSGTLSSTSKTLIGDVSYNNPKNVYFTASNAETRKGKGKWTGNVTFYLERK